MKETFAVVLFTALCFLSAGAQEALEKDTVKTAAGDVELTFIGHGSLMMKFNGKIIQVDPVSKLTDYSLLPKADLVLITHEHPDHFDPTALQSIRTDGTVVVLTEKCSQQFPGGAIMKNGDSTTIMGVTIEAVPAYNVMHKRENGQPFHPRGEGNGYVLTFGDKRVYIAGDTENTPEVKALKNIDIAFLPMSLPYTMTPGMVADAVKAFKPKVLYPYHYGDTVTNRFVALLKNNPEIEVRVRKMK